MIKFLHKSWVRRLSIILFLIGLCTSIKTVTVKNTETGYIYEYVRPEWVKWSGIFLIMFMLVWAWLVISNLKNKTDD